MQTLKEILGREAERRNLLSMAVCFLTVVALVALFFGAAQMQALFEGTPGPAAQEEPVVVRGM